MKQFQTYLIVFLTLFFFVASAQQKLPASWSVKFKDPVNWQRVHSLGYLIVSTNGALFGVNPDDGKIMWENKTFASLDASSFSEVDATEFASVSFKTNSDSQLPMQAILHVASGKVLFDSQKEGIAILSRHVLPASGKLLIIGARPQTFVASLFMYDISTGQQLWANDDLFKVEKSETKGFLGKLQSMGEEIKSLRALTSEPLELDKDDLILTHPDYVIRLNSSNGKVIWKNRIESSQQAQVHFSSHRKGVVYIGTDVESETSSGFTTTVSTGASKEQEKSYDNLYYAFDVNTGRSIWKAPAREKDRLNLVIPHEKGLIICPRSSQKPTINLVSYETGTTQWGKKGKGIRAEGSVVSYISTKEGIVISTAFDNAWNDKAEEYYLNILDPNTGALKFDKSLKLKGELKKIEVTPKGLLFITTKEINILDPGNGKVLWADAIEAGNPFNQSRPFPVGDNQAGQLTVYSPKERAVFKIDKQVGTAERITPAKIEFEGKETPRSIEITSDGIIMSSEQNIMKLGNDGTVKYHRYYPAPREPALLRALMAAEAIRGAYIGAAAGIYSAALGQGAQQTSDPGGKAVAQGLSEGFGDLSKAGFNYSAGAMKQFNARYKASVSAPDFIMMMAKQAKRGNQLVQVSKTNGEILNSIDIKNDKEPEYEVDQIYNHVYYRVRPEEIVCYKLN